MTEQPAVVKKSWFIRIFGRSLIRILFGNFFENKNNTASILAIILIVTLCYVILVKEKYEYMNGLLNVVFVIIGYYFGARKPKSVEEEDEP